MANGSEAIWGGFWGVIANASEAIWGGFWGVIANASEAIWFWGYLGVLLLTFCLR